MLAQRATQQSLRRLVAGNRTVFSKIATGQYVAPTAVGLSMQIRPATSQRITNSDAHTILAAQRKQRPVAPHLSIYRPQIPWILSALNRITGGILSGGFYIFGAAYLVSPLFGWHLDSATMAASFAAWPVALKVLTKTAIALPFTFHSFNGLRHLSWDFGKLFKNKQVINSGMVVIGLTGLSTLYLALFV
ncbi:hypothetical protein F5884DRAFT_800797 [Xylogone sp. PMI_703]|nr:hypothetical protein F5884DRAFT_800797 [Xylogone sp. PMI_703]